MMKSEREKSRKSTLMNRKSGIADYKSHYFTTMDMGNPIAHFLSVYLHFDELTTYFANSIGVSSNRGKI